jgi:ATP-dependent DNA helicase PIF1
MTDEQAAVMKLALRKQSIFFTGSAGTGKTWLLSKLIEMLKFNLPIGSVAVTGIYF